MSGEGAGLGQVVILGVAEDLFAIPVSRVQEILDRRQIARLPDAPPHVLGVIDVRGAGVSVIDLRSILGLAPKAEDDSTRILVLWIEEGGRKARIAMRADRVIEVRELDNDRLDPVPEAELLHWDHRTIAGLGRRAGEFVSVLDIDRLQQVFGGSVPQAPRISAA
ncbi:chemotaxis protein CheW [Thioclava sp. GXIMD2076]|uniref:chemotaxis protein CheW n=1 Tax=unclassified Thioclava TaxID=2621713 RepID=UPI0030CF0F5D